MLRELVLLMAEGLGTLLGKLSKYALPKRVHQKLTEKAGVYSQRQLMKQKLLRQGR